MELRQLRYFVAIVDCGSFTKAAKRVFVAQPALSQQLASLESELGARMLVRGPRGVRPTDEGIILYDHARRVLQEVESAKQQIVGSRIDSVGTVAVGLPPTISSLVAVPFFRSIRQSLPRVHLQLALLPAEQLSEALGEGRLDMCVTYRQPRPDDEHVQLLLEESLYVIGAPDLDLPDDGTCPIATLSGVPVVLSGHRHTSTRALIDRSFAQASSELNVIAEIDSVSCLVLAAAERMACTILPWSALPKDYGAHGSVRLLVDPQIQRSVSLATSSVLPRTQLVDDVKRALTETITHMVLASEWCGAALKIADETSLFRVVS